MRTPEQQAAFDAVKRMGIEELQSMQLMVLQSAVRALMLASPEPEKLRGYFDQLISQAQAYPGVVTSDDRSIVLRDMVSTLFRPTVTPP
jgi:hypothetical protein